MKVLITGSRGFVGQSVGRFSLGRGHEVLGLSRASQPQTTWGGGHVRADVGVDDMADIIKDFQPDLIVHAAGSASVADSIRDPAADFRATATTFLNVLDGVRRSGVSPILVQVSSAAVYGNPRSLPVDELADKKPISPYGYHKLFCEMLAHEYAQSYGISSVICRVFSLFGPLQKRLLVWELYRQFAGGGERIELQGTGNETRDFLHVDDLADAILRLAVVAPRNQVTTLNVASGLETCTRELANEIGAVLTTEKTVACRGQARPGDPVRWWADVSNLKAMLGDWQPCSLREALARTFVHWR